jgi:hypothetical protein
MRLPILSRVRGREGRGEGLSKNTERPYTQYYNTADSIKKGGSLMR